MRNRRMVLAIFLLVAVFCIGSGFAAVTDVLDIWGTAEVDENSYKAAYDADIYFIEASAENVKDSAHVDANNNDRASFTVNSLGGQDDTAEFTFVVANYGDLSATLTLAPVSDGAENPSNNNTTFFDFAYQLSEETIPAKAGNEPGKATVTVTVRLLQTPTSIQSATFDLELYATADNTP